MKRKLPDSAKLEELAAKRPDLINALVAYFVFEWQDVEVTKRGLSGHDQTGVHCVVPNYVSSMGVEACLDALKRSPQARGPTDPGGISAWLEAAI